MKNAYLAVETHAGHAGLVRLRSSEHQPDPAPTARGPERIRYIARFNDGDAALMHTHELLKRRLLDPDAHLYRVPFERAIAALESLDLRHRQVYLDADLSADTRAEITRIAERYRQRRQAWDALFRTLGYIAIGMLLLNLFSLSMP